MSQKHLIVPHFIGPASLGVADCASFVANQTPLHGSISFLHSRARSNLRRGMVSAWVAESIVQSGRVAEIALFEGWNAHEVRQLHREVDGMKMDQEILTGAAFEDLLLRLLRERKAIDFDTVTLHPVSRCTLQEVLGIRARAQELLGGSCDSVQVVSITDRFLPARDRLQSYLDTALCGQKAITAKACTVDEALHAFDVPIDGTRQQLLKASRLSKGEQRWEMLHEMMVQALHSVSELHRFFRHPVEGEELEARMAGWMRKDVQQ